MLMPQVEMDQEGVTFWPAEAKVQKWSQRIDLAIRTETMTPGEVCTCCLLLHSSPHLPDVVHGHPNLVVRCSGQRNTYSSDWAGP